MEDLRPKWRVVWDRWLEQAAARDYRLTRFVILRLLGFVYVAAFASLVGQLLPLIGHDGLLPADSFVGRATVAFGSTSAAFRQLPSLFFFGCSDGALSFFGWFGLVLSLVVLAGYANGLMMLVLWAVYMSFVHVGQLWYGYGWEIELLENGFLAIFLCPLLDGRPFPRTRTPFAMIVLYRWLAFRIMLGAGLIKIRGDPCWRDLTCLVYHYETQPIPNPVSRWLHFMPRGFHVLGTAYNHLVELVAPWGVFGPRTVRHVAGVLLVAFQLMLIVSGNLSFLNWLTLIPMLACFDDGLLRKILPRFIVRAADRAAESEEAPARGRRWAIGALCVLVAVLSANPISNMLSGEQVMNTSFDPLALVNTYGAFGSVGRQRDEIVFEGTLDDPASGDAVWKAYEFPCKPGDVMRRPCLTGPYQRRLDWQIWFAAMTRPEQAPWTLHLVWKLLHADAGTLSLLDGDPFDGKAPRAIRARLFRYQMVPAGDESGAWWKRELIGEWLPPLTVEDPRLLQFLDAYGWR